jgi:hypothetical protein
MWGRNQPQLTMNDTTESDQNQNPTLPKPAAVYAPMQHDPAMLRPVPQASFLKSPYRPLAAAASAALETDAPQPQQTPQAETTESESPKNPVGSPDASGDQSRPAIRLPGGTPLAARVEALEATLKDHATGLARLELLLSSVLARVDSTLASEKPADHTFRGRGASRQGEGSRTKSYIWLDGAPTPEELATIRQQREMAARRVFFRMGRASSVQKNRWKWSKSCVNQFLKRIYEMVPMTIMINQLSSSKAFRAWATRDGREEATTYAERIQATLENMPDLWIETAGVLGLTACRQDTVIVASAREMRERGLYHGPVWTDPGFDGIPRKGPDPWEDDVIVDIEELIQVSLAIRTGRMEWKASPAKKPHAVAVSATAPESEDHYAFFTRLAEERRKREAEKEARKNRALVLDRENGEWFIPGAEDEDED